MSSRESKKEIELKKELKKEGEEDKGQHTHILGNYQNVYLLNQDLEQLKIEMPTHYESYIEKLSEYMASTGKTYKSHIATIRKWFKEDIAKPTRHNPKVVRNYDYQGEDSL